MACKGSKAFIGGHDWQDAPNGWETCRNKNCGERRVKKQPKQRNAVEIKGGKWGNKADKQMSKDKSRKNPPKK